ncbi:AF1514 family protein [Halothiobacillus sp.]|uniref:AF1514 family protein n=1 Tax=Halothiobacillus sp. TaxID=1891311 RepID=UPI0026362ED4|nr:AF1514 family protein [Halothiobacillus sp.]
MFRTNPHTSAIALQARFEPDGDYTTNNTPKGVQRRPSDGVFHSCFWQNARECHRAGAIPGYADYALIHGATLRENVEGGRFVFFELASAHLD